MFASQILASTKRNEREKKRGREAIYRIALKCNNIEFKNKTFYAKQSRQKVFPFKAHEFLSEIDYLLFLKKLN